MVLRDGGYMLPRFPTSRYLEVVLHKLLERPGIITFAYLLLMIVMGGRTALFVAHFDTLIHLGEVTIIAILFAVALALAVPGAAYARSISRKGSNAHRTAGWVMIGAAVTDGAFNVSEAILLANETGIFTEFVGLVQYWLYFTLLLVGVAPTVLTIGLASLAGLLMKSDSSSGRNTRTRIALAVEHTAAASPSMDAHWTRIDRHLGAGDVFTRTEIEQWTGLQKGQAINVIRYGRDHGFVSEAARGQYVYAPEESHA